MNLKKHEIETQLTSVWGKRVFTPCWWKYRPVLNWSRYVPAPAVKCLHHSVTVPWSSVVLQLHITQSWQWTLN